MATDVNKLPDRNDVKRFFNAVRLRDVDCVASILAEFSLPPGNIIDNIRDDEGHTCLHWAALNGATELVQWFLKQEPHHVDVVSYGDGQRGQTPLMWAAVANRGMVLELLLQLGAAVDLRDGRGHTALLHAAQYGHVGICKRLMDAKKSLLFQVDNEGGSVLHWAAYRGCHAVVKYFTLIWAKEIDVELMDKKGYRPLHRACQRGDQIIVLALLKAGANPDARIIGKDDGQSPIEVAKARMHYGCVATIIAWKWGEFINGSPRRYPIRRHILVLFYYLILCVSYYLFVTRIARFAPPSSSIMLLFHMLLFLVVLSSVLCTYGDPGFVKCGTLETFQKYLDDAVSNGRDDKLAVSAYCYSCLIPRPPRSKHCRPLDRCVMRFDHWCPWLNNAVGMNNHRSLIAFALTLPLTQWVYVIMALKFLLYRARETHVSFVGVMSREITLTALCGIHIFLSLFSAVLFVTHVKLIAAGRTTNEQLNAKRYGITNNPYDEGVKANCINFWKMTGKGIDVSHNHSDDKPSPAAVV